MSGFMVLKFKGVDKNYTSEAVDCFIFLSEHHYITAAWEIPFANLISQKTYLIRKMKSGCNA
jgi:hypothetical protein